MLVLSVLPEEMYGWQLLSPLILMYSDTVACRTGNDTNMLVCLVITKDVGTVSIA